MHLVITGPIRNLYATQVALTHARDAKRAVSKLSYRFHQDTKFWRNLCVKMIDRPTYLEELVHQTTFDLGYTYTLGLGVRGVWIDPHEDGNKYTWRVQYPAGIT